MAKRLCNIGDNEAAVDGGEDRLSALPDDLIQLVLSFLNSGEAVQTCVLATRWRNLWKSVPSLWINYRCYSADFVNSLLRCRDPTPLHECEIVIEDNCTDELHRDAEQWLRYVVSCKVRVLTFDMLSCVDGLPLSAGPLVSEHLTRLELFRIGSKDFPLDVSSCQSLQELEIRQGVINIGNIGTHFPKSLRLLRIRYMNFLPKDTRSFISAPGLLTLELVDCFGPTPFLSTPSLIFRTEINWCLVFSNLKTLLLGDWIMTANFSGLVCFLQHSPVLEMLTLQLSILCKQQIKPSEVYKPKKQFLVSKYLKAVEIIYCKGAGKIDQVLNVLACHGVQPEQINIKREPYIGCFSCNST